MVGTTLYVTSQEKQYQQVLKQLFKIVINFYLPIMNQTIDKTRQPKAKT